MNFEPGQQWAYAAPSEIPDSRIVIGAIVEFEGGAVIMCCAVTIALQSGAGGTSERTAIPFLPMSREALELTVTELDGQAPCPRISAGSWKAGATTRVAPVSLQSRSRDLWSA